MEENPGKYTEFMVSGSPINSTFTSGGAKAGSADTQGLGASNPGLSFLRAPANQGSAATGVIQYSGKLPEVDIWHSKTDLNLFQIVSDRLVKAAPRVMPLGTRF